MEEFFLEGSDCGLASICFNSKNIGCVLPSDQSSGVSGEKRDEKDIWDEVSALGETVGGRESLPLVLSSALGIMMFHLCTNHTR